MTVITPAPRSLITGVVLAGGAGQRMGGTDKGLVTLNGRPMVEYVLTRLRPQVGAIVISANRNAEAYATYGCPVIPDAKPGYLGPLAGMVSGMRAATTPYMMMVPCDSPLLAPDLATRLYSQLVKAQADISVAHDGERMHPVFALMRRELVGDLEVFLDSGERKIDIWFARHRLAVVDFSDEREAFLNVNCPHERAEVEAHLAGRWVKNN